MDSLKIQNLYPDYQTIKAKTDTIYLTLQRMGYIDAELYNLQKDNDTSYTANFNLGKKYRSIKIYYQTETFTIKELKQISSTVENEYFLLPIEEVPFAIRKLTAVRNKKGNAFARLRLTDLEKNPNDELTASLFVDNGALRTVDSIVVKGYEKFPRSFLKHYAGIKKGKIFNKSKLVLQSEILNGLGFVSTSKTPEALFRKDSTIVYLYLDKKNNNQFDGILGFATDEETQKLEFNGFLNLELNNNLNYGEQLLLNYKADGKEQIQFRVKAVLPYLFQSPFGLSGELKIFKRDSTFITTEQLLRTTYQLKPSSQAYLGYKAFESSNLLDQTVAGIPIEDFKSKFLTAGSTYRKQQNRSIFPIKTFLALDLGIGKRNTKGESESQFQVQFEGQNIFNLNQKNSIFLGISASTLISDTYLVNELFRFGGINSIRGFEENSIDASLFSVLNTEYRYQFNEAVFAHSIIDLAYFENQTLSQKQKLYSFGFGMGLLTKAGLFRFNLANGNTEDQNFNLSNIKIHISLTSRF